MRNGEAIKDQFLTLRLQEELLKRLQELAARNERTVAGEVRLAIREHVERQKNGSRATR